MVKQVGYGDERTIDGQLQIVWECAYESRNGKECGKKHWVNWPTADGEYLRCAKHRFIDIYKPRPVNIFDVISKAIDIV